MALCCHNGELLLDSTLRLDAADRGLTLGDGVFDTQLFINGTLPDGDAHFSRLLRHASTIHIPVPWSVADLVAFALQLSSTDVVIRTQITRGPAARGLALPEKTTPTLIMRALPIPAPRTAPKLMISSIRRNETSPLSQIKATHYLDAILALKDAQDQGCDDAVFLNTQGHLTCATSANIFIVENSKWVTPPLADGVLEGITRARVIREKNSAEQSISEARLRNADEIWLTNSVRDLEATSGLKI